MTTFPLLVAMLMSFCCSSHVTATCRRNSTIGCKLLVVLLDGFRWDYPQKVNLTVFERLKKKGAHAGYLSNDFPTLSYPNYYSLMTGLHTESHGMTGNFMYDITSQSYFLLGQYLGPFNRQWWEGGEPLWVSVVKQNKKVYMYHWPGCEVSIFNTTPTFCRPYTNVTSMSDFRLALADARHVLMREGVDLALVYHEEPDYVGHKYGPDSSQVADTLRALDVELRILLKWVKKNGEVNLIIVSDHGMTSIDPSKVINITKVLTQDLYLTVLEAGSIVSIYTGNKQKTDQVYNLLKDFSPRMQVYRKEDIPDRYHYKRGKFVADVTCVADLGWVITQPQYPGFLMKEGQNLAGYHGYDNKYKDMRGIFYSYGPYFKQNVQVPSLRAVDPYNIMCDVLGIKPAPNNGTKSVLPRLRRKKAAN